MSAFLAVPAIDPTDSVWCVLNKTGWFSNLPVGQWWADHYRRTYWAAPRKDERAYDWLSHFCWRDRWGAEATLDGVELQIALQERARGFEPFRNSKVLRTCAACITLGTHSVVHEPNLLKYCLVHHSPLKPGCPQCGAQFDLADANARKWGPAFACAGCARETDKSFLPLGTNADSAMMAAAAASLKDWVEATATYRWPVPLRGMRCGADWNSVSEEPVALMAADVVPFSGKRAFGPGLRNCELRVSPAGVNPVITLHREEGCTRRGKAFEDALLIQEGINKTARDLRQRHGRHHPCLWKEWETLRAGATRLAAYHLVSEFGPCPVRVAFDAWRNAGAAWVRREIINGDRVTGVTLRVSAPELQRLMASEFYLMASAIVELAAYGAPSVSAIEVARWPTQVLWQGLSSSDYAGSAPVVYPTVDYAPLLDLADCRSA